MYFACKKFLYVQQKEMRKYITKSINYNLIIIFLNLVSLKVLVIIVMGGSAVKDTICSTSDIIKFSKLQNLI